tara:strand:+ start:6392 stop:7051 length:660 start_codon:yes stop_codon:yes gene_type:complete
MNCQQCHRPALTQHKLTVSEPIPYKQNGWIGDQFVPYGRKYRTVKDKVITVCGLCYIDDQIELMRIGGENMTELEQELLTLATKEYAHQNGQQSSNNGHKAGAVPKPKVARKGRRRKRRDAMTPDQARTFNTFSGANAAAVAIARPCGCMPYVDVFTYNRWRAQGFQVQHGEKAVSIPIVKDVPLDDDAAPNTVGKLTTRRIMGTSKVFCRCQVKERAA